MSFAPNKLSAHQLIVYGVTLLFGFALVVGWLQSQSVSDMKSMRDWIKHTRSVQAALTDFRDSLLDAESNQRGYLLTHAEIYLDPYTEGVAMASRQFRFLTSLTQDNPLQQSHLNKLEPLLNDKFQFMAQTISLEKSGDHAGALQLVGGGGGQRDMATMMSILDSMDDIESQLLFTRQTTYRHNFKINTILSIVSLSFCLSSLVLILLIVRYLERLQANVMLTALKEMVEYEKGNISVEEYIKRRFSVLEAHGAARAEAERLLGILRGGKDKRTG